MNAEQAVVKSTATRSCSLHLRHQRRRAYSTAPSWCCRQRRPASPACCLPTTASATSAASTICAAGASGPSTESHDMTVYGGWMTKVGPSLVWNTGRIDLPIRRHGSPRPAFTIRTTFRSPEPAEWTRTRAPCVRITIGTGCAGWPTAVGASTPLISFQPRLRLGSGFPARIQSGPMGFKQSRDNLLCYWARSAGRRPEPRERRAVKHDWQRVGGGPSMRYERDPSLGRGTERTVRTNSSSAFPALDMFALQGPDHCRSFLWNSRRSSVPAACTAPPGTTGVRRFAPKLYCAGFGLWFRHRHLPSLRQTYYDTDRGTYQPRSMYGQFGERPARPAKPRTMVDMDIEGIRRPTVLAARRRTASP